MILNKHRLVHLKSLLKKYRSIDKYVSLDFETTGLNVYKGARSFAYSYGDGSTGKVTVRRYDDCSRKKRVLYRKELQDLLDDENTAIICHNYKFEYTILTHENYTIPEDKVVHCTLLMSQLLQNLNPSHALDYLMWEIAGKSLDLAKKVEEQAKARGYRWDRVDKPLMHEYQIRDGEDPLFLFFTWIDQFQEDELLYLDYLNELEMVKVTVREQDFGVTLCWENSNKLISYLETSLEETQEDAFSLLGEYVNFNSHPQVCKLLFKRFKYPILEIDRDTRKASVDKPVLLKYKEMRPHKILDIILKYRAYSSALSMVKSYQTHADDDGTIHPIINPNEASTGRQSSEDPNMQNIRKGRKDESNPYAVNIRTSFKCKSGHIQIFADYSAIEMKLIIEVANSIKMINFMKKGINPHIIACNIFFGKHLIKSKRFVDKKTTPALYDYGKNTHFCLGYGGGPDACAATMKLPIEEAMPGILEYQEEFPEIAFLTRDIGAIVKRDGYVSTPFGRKLSLPRSKYYAGLNYLIQGTAAGILKRAQVESDRYLREVWDDQIRIVLPIHDEIIFSVPRYLLPELQKIIRGLTACMVEIPFIKVPLEVEWKKSNYTWDQAKPLEVTNVA